MFETGLSPLIISLIASVVGFFVIFKTCKIFFSDLGAFIVGIVSLLIVFLGTYYYTGGLTPLLKNSLNGTFSDVDCVAEYKAEEKKIQKKAMDGGFNGGFGNVNPTEKFGKAIEEARDKLRECRKSQSKD